MSLRRRLIWLIVLAVLRPLPSEAQNPLTELGRPQEFTSHRISSFDRSGGNADRLTIGPGETVTLADIQGPAAIHHIWITIDAEPFYGRKIILRMFWDGERHPSVEGPLGDFFGVGHGLNRNLSSLPITNSSEGRARNCYWFMPFNRSARITVSNEGANPVGAFYYYIDYRKLSPLPPDTPYFHSSYRQEIPCHPGKNYTLLEAEGKGHYVGCILSILQTAMGWWGEGDDMIYVDGEELPSLHGTGSEDYFSDAWGMREDENLFYGCPLQEPDFQAGSKATVYRFHIPDPIPFKESIRVTIEHGHANDRSDLFSSTAFWYQSEPHQAFEPLPDVHDRLPMAWESPVGYVRPEWKRSAAPGRGALYIDDVTRMTVGAARLSDSLTLFYDQSGRRFPVLTSEDLRPGDSLCITFPVDIDDRYDIELDFLTGPDKGGLQAVELVAGDTPVDIAPSGYDGQTPEPGLATVSIPGIRLTPGTNSVTFRVPPGESGKGPLTAAFLGLRLAPSCRKFVTAWNLIGPFEAPDMSFLQHPFPPEREIRLDKAYKGKEGRAVRWQVFEAGKSGYIRLDDHFQPPEKAVVYGLTHVLAPTPRQAWLLIGSDDGIRVWVNGELVHSNPAYRGASPDQDRIKVDLRQGWNEVLVKILQGAGGWGFYLRFVDPEDELRFSPEAR